MEWWVLWAGRMFRFRLDRGFVDSFESEPEIRFLSQTKDMATIPVVVVRLVWCYCRMKNGLGRLIDVSRRV